jgi:transglutaminase-like putative cysteine protease
MRTTRSRSALALAGTSAAAAAGYARLFADAGWVLPVGAAVLGAHSVATVTRRWSWPRAAAAQLGALLLLLAWVVGGHTVAGLPTPATFSGLGQAAAHTVDAFRAAIVPAPSTPELVLLAAAGTWVCAAVADGLARRRQAGLLSVVPLVVVHAFVATLGTSRWRPLTAFAFAGAVCAFAVVEQAEGLPRGWAVSRSPRPYRPALASSALAVVVATAALALGPVVPGGASEPILDVHAFGVQLDVSRVELNPLVDLRPQLSSPTARELFTVRSALPAYWRLTALDRFDGRLWSPARPVPRRLEHRVPESQRPQAEPLRQEFRITALDSPWLPAAHRALRVRAAGARLDPESDSVITRRGSQEVRTYRVESGLPGEEETAARPEARRLRGAELERYLALPDDFPASVRALARRFVAGTSTPYDQAIALQDHLRVGYAYYEEARPGHSNDDLEYFLFRSLHGYCEQFAGAFAAMARSLGLPARLAVGFTPGTYDPDDGVWRVTTKNAHAWPELYLDGMGWVPFEPTPGRAQPFQGDGGSAALLAQLRPATGRSRAGGDASSPAASILLDGSRARDLGPPKGDLPGGPGLTGWLAGLPLVLGSTLLLAPLAKGLRRRARRAGRRGERVAAAWRESLDRLVEAGLAPRGGETPLEFAARAGRARPGTGPDLVRLAKLMNGSAYAPRPPAPASAGHAWAAATQLVRALDAGDPPWTRWRRRLDPRPLFPGRSA